MLFFIFLTGLLDSIPKDSVKVNFDTNEVRYYPEKDFFAGKFKVFEDTSIHHFQIYDPVKRSSPFYAGLGNTGLPAFNLVFNPDIPMNFDLGLGGMEPYFFTRENVIYYDNKRPLTLFKYFIGSRKENVLNVTHSRNINPYWNITGKFQKIKSDGFFSRQKVNQSNYGLVTNFKSPDKRYQLVGAALHNSSRQDENGGLVQNDSVEFILPDQSLLEINLDNAKSKLRQTTFYLNQVYNIISRSDSATGKHFTIGINYDISFKKDQYVYFDSILNKSFYKNFYFDSIAFRDSVNLKRLNNKAGIVAGFQCNSVKSKFSINAGSEKIILIRRHGPDPEFDQDFLTQENKLKFEKYELGFKTFFKTYLSGYNKSDYHFKFDATLNEEHLLNYNIGMGINQFAPAYYQNSFYSNSYRWENNFNKIKIKSVDGAVNYQPWEASMQLRYSTIENFIYLNARVAPVQLDNNINVFQIEAIKNLTLGILNLRERAVFQNLNGTPYEISYPAFLSASSLYLNIRILRKALNFQSGMDFVYTTSYYAPSYNPVIHNIYYPMDAIGGNYFYADFFMNFKVKSVRVSIKLENFLDGVFNSEPKYFGNYPITPRSFKFGLAWDFHD